MELYFTGAGAVFASILWVFAGAWEWSVPKNTEEKLIRLREKFNYKNAFFQLKENKTIFDHEQFAYYIKALLPRLEKELKMPIHVEVQIENSRIITDLEKKYINCLTRVFPQFTWCLKEGLEFSSAE